MCKQVRDLVNSDKRIQVEEIAHTLGISHRSVSTILHDRLGMLSQQPVRSPKSLSDEQMATRASVCRALLKRFRLKDDFLLCLVTVDETWIHYYKPENKAQSRQWIGPGSPRPKNFKTQLSASKVMATVFWDAEGFIMLDFLPKRRSITEVYYAHLLDQLKTAIREKRRVNSLRVFCCDRATRESSLAMDAIERNGYELLPHPAYSPDLAPSDFYLFPNLKKDVCGSYFIFFMFVRPLSISSVSMCKILSLLSSH